MRIQLFDHILAASPSVVVPPDINRTHFRSQVATYIKERTWHATQVLKERRDGSLEMRLTTSGRKELVRWILSWMPEVEVLAPAELRERVRARLREGLRRTANR